MTGTKGRSGRPKKKGGAMVNLVVRVPKAWRTELRRQAKIHGFESPSDWHRNLLADFLATDDKPVKGVPPIEFEDGASR